MYMNNYKNYKINVEDFQISKQMLCFNSDIITSGDPILVEKSVMHVDYMFILVWNLVCGSHMHPFGSKKTTKKH